MNGNSEATAKDIHVMVDLETTGLDPARHAIIEIGMIAFDIDTFIPLDDGFLTHLAIPRDREWDGSTWKFHEEHRPDLIEAFSGPVAVPAFGHAFNAAETYLLRLKDQPEDCVWFWCNHTHFDWALWQSYCRQYNIVTEFKYFRTVDMDSFGRGVAWPHEYTRPKPERATKKHHAHYDACYQLEVLRAVLHENGWDGCSAGWSKWLE